MLKFSSRSPASAGEPACMGSGPAEAKVCVECPLSTACSNAADMWKEHRSLRTVIDQAWKASDGIGRTSDPKHVYETEWRRMFSSVPDANMMLTDQLCSPFTDMLLDQVAQVCALKKVPLWLFIRAQMDTMRHFDKLKSKPFDVTELDNKWRWDRYEKYMALLDRNSLHAHSGLTDLNSDWIRSVKYAALDEAEIGRLLVDAQLYGRALTRTEAVETVGPRKEWAGYFGSMKERMKATDQFGVHLMDTGNRLARLESLVVVLSGYWPMFPDRVAARLPFTWVDVAGLVQSMFVVDSTTPTALRGIATSWSPNARDADQV